MIGSRRLTRSTTLLALALCASIASAPAPAQAADTVLAQAPRVSGITAYAGQVIMSQLDPATQMWALVRYENGALSSLPVAERSVPFDASAGPDAAGNPVVVYSRCSKEPVAVGGSLAPTVDWETASGCNLYELSLTGTPTEQELTAASRPGESETTPSIWRGNLAFVRHATGSAVPTIEYLPLGAKQPRHLSGGSVQLCEQDSADDADCRFNAVHDTVEQLDLGPSRIAYLWNMTGGSVYGVGVGYELRSATLDGGRSTLLDTGLISGECGFALPSAPTATTSEISYLEASAACDNTVTSFATVDPVTGIRGLAPTPGGLAAGAVRDGDTIYWLRVSAQGPDVSGPADASPPAGVIVPAGLPVPSEVSVPGGGACANANATCELVSSSLPQYVAQPATPESSPADIDFVNSGLGYKWVGGPGGTRLLRPPATIPCAPSAVAAYVYVSAQWSRGKHTVRVLRQDPGKAARSVTVIGRSLPDFEVAAEPRLLACGDSTRLTYAVTSAGGTQRVSFVVARLRARTKSA